MSFIAPESPSAEAPSSPAGKVVRVAMIDDHEVVSIAIGALVDGLADFEFVGAFRDVDELLAAQVAAELVVLDLNLGNGTSPTVNVARLHEQGSMVIAFTSAEHPFLLRMAARAGVLGVIRKSAPAADFTEGLRRAARGDVVVSADWAAAIDSDPELAEAVLSPQEGRVLQRYASGMAAKSVAYDLGISEHTVEDYLKRIRSQYAAVGRWSPTKVDLYKRALEDGYLPFPHSH